MRADPPRFSPGPIGVKNLTPNLWAVNWVVAGQFTIIFPGSLEPTSATSDLTREGHVRRCRGRPRTICRHRLQHLLLAAG